jgi:hypothetical protein
LDIFAVIRLKLMTTPKNLRTQIWGGKDRGNVPETEMVLPDFSFESSVTDIDTVLCVSNQVMKWEASLSS